jgi:hypothetical protein
MPSSIASSARTSGIQSPGDCFQVAEIRTYESPARQWAFQVRRHGLHGHERTYHRCPSTRGGQCRRPLPVYQMVRCRPKYRRPERANQAQLRAGPLGEPLGHWPGREALSRPRRPIDRAEHAHGPVSVSTQRPMSVNSPVIASLSNAAIVVCDRRRSCSISTRSNRRFEATPPSARTRAGGSDRKIRVLRHDDANTVAGIPPDLVV